MFTPAMVFESGSSRTVNYSRFDTMRPHSRMQPASSWFRDCWDHDEKSPDHNPPVEKRPPFTNTLSIARNSPRPGLSEVKDSSWKGIARTRFRENSCVRCDQQSQTECSRTRPNGRQVFWQKPACRSPRNFADEDDEELFSRAVRILKQARRESSDCPGVFPRFQV